MAFSWKPLESSAIPSYAGQHGLYRQVAKALCITRIGPVFASEEGGVVAFLDIEDSQWCSRAEAEAGL